MSVEEKDLAYLEIALSVSLLSKDPHRKVGALVVDADRRYEDFGYNGFPSGIADDKRLENKETKHPLMIHAERNALDKACFDLRGGTLYCTRPICLECAKSAKNLGITRAVVFDEPQGREWEDTQYAAARLFEEAMVEMKIYVAEERKRHDV